MKNRASETADRSLHFKNVGIALVPGGTGFQPVDDTEKMPVERTAIKATPIISEFWKRSKDFFKVILRRNTMSL